MPKGIPPKAKECRCWRNYPNPYHEKRCSYYECIKPMMWGGKRRKTVCRLKESDAE